MSVSAEQVKELRDKTGAPMMDCKRALEEAKGDAEKALFVLRQKGQAKAGTKQGRTTMDGAIGCYVHAGNRLGVMLEVGCETDFVARNEVFSSLLKELAMHIAASKPQVVRREDLPEETVEKEKAVYASQVENKPPQVVEKIIQGKLDKFYSEVCLLEQPYIRDTDKTVGELLDETIAKLGEKIEVRRFVLMQVGEGEQ